MMDMMVYDALHVDRERQAVHTARLAEVRRGRRPTGNRALRAGRAWT